jgi:hypothetical protein
LPPLAARQDSARPKVPAIFDVVTLWARENPEVPETGLGRILFLSPQGETLIEQDVEVDLREVKRLRSFGRITGFPTRGPGVYHFRIDSRPSDTAEWRQVGRVPLDVSIEPVPDEPRANGEVTARS